MLSVQPAAGSGRAAAYVVCGPDPASLGRAIAGVDWAEAVWAHVGPPDKAPAALPAERGIDLSDRFDECFDRLRQDYIDYIGSIAEPADRDWWTSLVAEKNPYASSTFLLACCASVCLGLDAPGRVVVLVVDDAALRETLVRNLARTGVDVRIEQPPAAGTSSLRLLFERIVRLAHFVAHQSLRVVLSRYWLRLHRLAAIRKAARGGRTAIVHTWVDQRAYDHATGKFSDADFAAVAAYLETRGVDVLSIPMVLRGASYRRVIGYVSRARASCVVPHAFARVRDVVSVAAAEALRRPLTRPEWPPFAGVDVTPLLERDCALEWRAARRVHYAFQDKWIRRFRSAGISAERVIYTFENHAWERTFCDSWRRWHPGVRLISHQPNGLPRFLMNYFISDRERGAPSLPDLIVTNGQYAARTLSGSGYDPRTVVAGGGLRQSHVQSALYERERPSAPRPARPAVLITPSIGLEATAELIRKACAAFGGSPQLDVRIKCHPSMPYDRVSGRVGVLPPNVSVTTDPISLLLPGTSVLVYNDGTFPGAEALAAGVPVIYVKPDLGLPLDALDAFPDVRLAARSPAELSAAVCAVLNMDDQALARWRERGWLVARELIGRVDDSTYRLFER